MKEALLLLSVSLNFYLMFRSLELIGQLYEKCIIDVPTKKNWQLSSVLIPFFGYMMVYSKYKKTHTLPL